MLVNKQDHKVVEILKIRLSKKQFIKFSRFYRALPRKCIAQTQNYKELAAPLNRQARRRALGNQLRCPRGKVRADL